MKTNRCEGSAFTPFIETKVPENELIVSRTDLKGVITHVNETFADISGYSAQELIGQSHNIVRHPDMPSSAFKEIWETITAKKTWKGYVKNLRKDGGYYWVHAEISGVYKNGELIEYKSLREPISRDKSIEMQIKYDAIRENENDSIRFVSYLNEESLSKIKNLAKENETTLGKALEQLLKA
ncbi:MAG: PAS domain-containing protein [Campylobacterota bacterium]|nr:PAS domain-containing protein [Campylobacterota bacterium]